jgi:hypothetical protein
LISIQTGMLVALGFLLASLLWVLLASAFWSRAVRLTTARLKRSMPVSEAEIKADRDRLRAEYAIRVHKLETSLDQAKLERARQLIEINRRDASISALETDVVTIRADLEENLNARRVLEQTVADRLPKVEARLSEAKRLLFNRDREIAELTQGAKRHKQALEEASSINAQRAARIDQLNSALTTRGSRGGRSKDEPQGEAALQTEVDVLRTKAREQAALIDRLQRRLGQGHIVPGHMTLSGSASPALASAEGDADQARKTLTEAEAAMDLARNPGALAESSPADREREIRALRARAEDQAGEIARLKAGLAAFEQADEGGLLKNSKIALRARAGSAEAQAERQTATISRLRAELATANERLARQAAHFMDEMSRIGSGAGAARQARSAGRDGRRKLVDRVAQVRPATATEKAGLPGALAGAADRSNGTGNGHSPKSERSTPANTAMAAAPAVTDGEGGTLGQTSEGPAKPETAPTLAPSKAAAEMPQTATIPERRKARLLDRITGLAKT